MWTAQQLHEYVVSPGQHVSSFDRHKSVNVVPSTVFLGSGVSFTAPHEVRCSVQGGMAVLQQGVWAAVDATDPD